MLDANERTMNEKTTGTYTAYLEDADGVVLPLSAILTVTLTLYDKPTGTIINSRNAQSVLNANNCTVHATSGLLTWAVQVLDTTLVSTTLAPGELEEHVYLFSWTYTASAETKTGRHESSFMVRNLLKVT